MESSQEAYGGRVKGRTESGTGMRTRIMAINIYMENETEREEESDPGLRIQVGETANKNPNGVTCVPPQARTRRMRMWKPRVLNFKQEVSRLDREPGAGKQTGHMITGESTAWIKTDRMGQGLEDSCPGIGRRKEEIERREGREAEGTGTGIQVKKAGR